MYSAADKEARYEPGSSSAAADALNDILFPFCHPEQSEGSIYRI